MAPYKMRGIIGRVGGKSKLRERIIGMMPKHTIYIEPFVGGGSVLFGRKEDPNIKEIVNDKDREVASVYSDTKAVGDKLEAWAPVSEAEFKRLLAQKSFSSPLERLRRNVKLSATSFRGNRRSYMGQAAVQEQINRGGPAKGAGKDYGRYKERLKNVRILNQDWKSVIKKYDSPNALIYLDPPYSTAAARKDYTNNDITPAELISFLKGVKGKFILSYDKNAEMRKLAREAGFKVMNVSTTYNRPGGRGEASRETKQEFIIRNY
tara:strand:- start:42 stop:833 length:792 start_codon:yes stop_codon:yes gene_type:complete